MDLHLLPNIAQLPLRCVRVSKDLTMAAIDFHTHAFPDEIAQRAIVSLEAGSAWKAVSAGTVGALLQSMDSSGVEISILCTIATKPDQPAGILKWCRKIRTRRIIPLPSVHPKTPDTAGWIKRIAEEGFPGIKLHPMYQEFHADDACMDDIYGAAAEAGLFIECHCGKDIAYPPEDDRADPIRFRRVIEKFPSLKLICMHMGGWRMWDEVERDLLGSAVYLETSFSLDELAPKRAADMIHRHGSDRVLFGTDWPWANQAKDIGLLRALPLEQKQIDAILFGNARKLLGF